jgi:hypothetical protein
MLPIPSIARLYRMASIEGLVSTPDRNAYRRAQRAFHRYLAEPGDLKGQPGMIACLAVAFADIGLRPGWIPETQLLAARIADVVLHRYS